MKYRNRGRSRQLQIRDNIDLVNVLLSDRTTNRNITWSTDSYVHMGQEFRPEFEIKPEWIMSKNKKLIQPRIKKHREMQTTRTRNMAEVFTPIWIVKAQNDLIDLNYIGLDITDYVKKIWLEITCGEAPYVCSRYDAVTGKPVSINRRVGFLDRKLKMITDNIDDKSEWMNLAFEAIKSCYAFEYHGDSLFIARENVLYSVIDYYILKFSENPKTVFLLECAEIISFNFFQMDGLDYSVPFSGNIKSQTKIEQLNLFDEPPELINMSPYLIKAKVMDWENNELKDFQDLLIRRDVINHESE